MRPSGFTDFLVSTTGSLTQIDVYHLTTWTDIGGGNNSAQFVLYVPACGKDYGDNPDTGAGTGVGNYKTLATDGGPSHIGVNGLFLGAAIDAEDGTLQNATANADDTDQSPDDEDAVASFPTLTIASDATYTVPVSVTNTTGSNAYLVGYIDFNKDGDFLDTGEQSATVTVNASGSQNVSFTTPVGMTAGNTYARFRLSQAQTEAQSSIGAWRPAVRWKIMR